MAPDWRQAWKDGVTPWDAGVSPPALVSLLERGVVPPGRIFVPGCGTGYDLATLARADREVVGLDLSELARNAFIASNGDLPGTVDYEVGDFFSYAPGEPFDFVWDYTFFCALDPDERGAWGEAMGRLLAPGGVLATLLFPYEDPISPRHGPPWPINERLVQKVVEPAFELLEVVGAEASHPGREGKERLALWRRVG